MICILILIGIALKVIMPQTLGIFHPLPYIFHYSSDYLTSRQSRTGSFSVSITVWAWKATLAVHVILWTLHDEG